MMIHRTAIVHPEAVLDADVQVGAYSVVGPGVVLGLGTVLEHYAAVVRDTRVGEHCRICAHSVVGSDPQDLSYQGAPSYAEIGDRTVIREYVTVNRGAHGEAVTRVGSDCLLMTGVHIAHDCQVGDHVIMANLATLAGHVTVEERAVIGGLAAFHQFVRVGRMAMVGGTAGVMQDVPPYCIIQGAPPATVRGLNTVGLKRAGVTAEGMNHLKHAFRLYFRRGMLREDALAEIAAGVPQTEEVRHFLRFLAADSKRGISKAEHTGETPLSVVGSAGVVPSVHGELELSPAVTRELKRLVDAALRERETRPPATDDVSGLG